jgi:signal transduction histidine kinase
MSGFATRVATMVWAVVLLACLALSFVLTQEYLQELEKQLAQQGQIIGESVARETELPLLTGDLGTLSRIAARAYASRGLRYCSILDSSGARVAAAGSRERGSAPDFTVGRQVFHALLGIEPDVWEFRTPVTIAELRPRREEPAFFDHDAPSVDDGPQQQIGTVLVGIDLGPLQASYRRVLLSSLVLTALVVVCAMAASMLLARFLVHPLRVLVRATDLIAQGALDTRIETQRTDELGTLAASFNAMAESVTVSRDELEEHNRTLEEKVQARTERLQMLNDELKEANRLKSEFLATVSHELRTPLNVILGYTSMMADGATGPVTDDQRKLLESVQRYSKLQLDLITNVLDFSRITSGKMSVHIERFALRPLLEDLQALNTLRVAHHDTELVLDIRDPLPEIESDRVKIQEIIQNLLDNAIKYTERGRVTLSAFVGLVRNHVIIQVSDTGIGIPPEELPHVFEEFRQVGESSTRRTGGVGLGLSIVKGLVTVLGGRISVRSEVGKGTTFSVELPVAPAKQGERRLRRVA